MATLLLSAVGTLVGGPVGGAIGALVGRQVDSAILGSGSREGPRLKELTATTSSYGSALPRHFGQMRVPGSIIWATELVEHSETQGGGKGRPSVTSYNYTASFAVALASRPILDIGRIWADGNLLRGAAGDLKADGTMRIYTGHGDQDADPLIAEIEGVDRCPAYRGLAYAVFEDLDLGDFFNRIPALTFEIIADSGFTLQDMVGEVIDDADADLALEGISGFSIEGSLAETLRQLDPMFPMDADANGELLTIARERLQAEPIALPEAAISVGDGDFGGAAGFARKRSPRQPRPPEVLRYYDTGRDYLPGLQRAQGRASPGQPQTIELPAAMSAANARALAETTARRSEWGRDRLAWRTSELDPSVAPGSIVNVPDKTGRWRVDEWEWRETGIELSLSRIVPTGADAQSSAPVDPGRVNPPADLAPPPTVLAAFELPWDGAGAGDTPATYAAVSSTGSNWSGAALFVDQGDGGLQSLGPSGRNRSILGTAQNALPPANPLLFDRTSNVTVQLIDDQMELADATGRQLSLGVNRALLGVEIIQFARAVPLGGGQWRLEALLRGRGGTETAAAEHVSGERFCLLDARPVALDPALIGSAADTTIVASGRGDPDPVVSAIAMQGITLRPLSPVHPNVETLTDGSLEMRWTRRSRGAWLWPDGVDAPLHEQAELYEVTYGPVDAPIAMWTVSEPQLTLAPETLSDLAAALPGGDLQVRQQGSYALSEPLYLTSLP
ncbi:MAG: phage tail protein [Novosphingobium sp.]|nr:hypothetical protein [Novosphingobium sp.]